jgi:hypothetical protein
MQVHLESEIFATDVTRRPADPSLVYGGAMIRSRIHSFPAFIRKMPQHMTPIVQKRENPQLGLLKQILGKLGGAQQMQGLTKQVQRFS